ncbi:serine hydrolase domain-containing protein [uncultured Abyssibacter sp.]|uniref:serine hydrolase domain-containing protein n=1 Tax=uncultured Abyssibacter sp. TaxID=2320202 RepID=UPI0032B1DAC6
MNLPVTIVMLTVIALLAGCAQQARVVEPQPEVVTSPLNVRATAWDERRLDRLNAAMPELLRVHHVAGATIALTGDGKAQWTGRFGTLEHTEVPLRLTGLREPVLAMLTLTLSREYGWSLRAPLADIAPSAALTEHQATLTPRELLSHTAGLGAAETARRGVWQESDDGIALLARALEAATGQPLSTLATQRILAPAGMTASRFDGTGTLITTTADYARFLQWLLSPARGDVTLATLLGVQTTVSQSLGLYWGLGWGLERRGEGGLAAFHWGGDPRFSRFMLLDPVRGRALVIVTDSDKGLGLITDVVAILDEEPHTAFDFERNPPTR